MSGGAAAFFALRVLGFRDRGQRSSRYIRGAVLGIALSVVPLVVVLVVADSMIEGITARYIEAGTYHLQARPFFAVGKDELEAKARAVGGSPEIKAAFAEIQCPGVAIFGSRTAGVAIRAVEQSFLDDPGTAAYLKLESGTSRLESANQILLGEELARNLGAKVGDIVSIATAKSSGAIREDSFTPKVTAYKVRGIVSAGYRELDALWAFVSLKAGARLASPGVSYSLIGVKVESPYGSLDSARASVAAALSSAGDGVEWTVLGWPEVERNVYKSFATTKALLLLVMAIAVAVAAINVSSALVMLVIERRRDIAILKSAGASPGFIGRVFVLAGLGVGACGTFLGIGAGALLSWRINDVIAAAETIVNTVSGIILALSGAAVRQAHIRLLDPAYYLERIPVAIDPTELGIVAGACLLLCLGASLIPASRASRLPPLEIFRKT